MTNPRYHSNYGKTATSDSYKSYPLTRATEDPGRCSNLRLGSDWRTVYYAIGSHQMPTLCKLFYRTVFVAVFIFMK